MIEEGIESISKNTQWDLWQWQWRWWWMWYVWGWNITGRKIRRLLL